ncbi:transposase domain-containing protein [Rhizobium rhizogenes]|uniref:transposase domain-containing protein n=1 Tax=Rhizobium rhizogenes TaxID=359 RepID=UPI001F2419B3|nr:transposase domain-containing protein [Rhizobium rhizogenes]
MADLTGLITAQSAATMQSEEHWWAYMTSTLTAIVNGHKQRRIDDLLPWNYPVTHNSKVMARK